MRRFSFKRGLSFLRQARAWSVVRRLTDGSIQLEAEDGELWNARESQIVAMCAKGILVVSEEQSFSPPSRPMVSRDLSSYPEALQAKARHGQRYLLRLLDQGPLVFVAAKSNRVSERWPMNSKIRIRQALPPSTGGTAVTGRAIASWRWSIAGNGKVVSAKGLMSSWPSSPRRSKPSFSAANGILEKRFARWLSAGLPRPIGNDQLVIG